MSTMNPLNPYGGTTPPIEQMIGNAYDNVRKVAQNINVIKAVDANKENIDKAALISNDVLTMKEQMEVAVSTSQSAAISANQSAQSASQSANTATSLVGSVKKAILYYDTFAKAQTAAATLPDGQKVSVDADENRNGRPTQYVVSGATLVFAGYARSMNAGVYTPTPLDFGADPYGIEDSSQAMSDFWAYIKTQLVNLYPSSLPFCREKYTIPAGVYRIASSVNWTGLRAWNVQVCADGVIFIGEVDVFSVIDNLDCRGVHVYGLSVLSRPGNTPNSGILIGPKGTDTCGNNKFTDVKILGQFAIAPMHNIGSETTRHDMCYYMNRAGFALAGDCLNMLGAASQHVEIRAPGSAVSFTNNIHVSCRFENADNTGSKKDAVYLEGTNSWSFDVACYFLAFAGAGIQLRERTGTFRNNSLHIAGLFETSQAPGLEYCMRVVVDNGVNTAIANLDANFGRSHAKTAIIRVETPAGTALTSGSVGFPVSTIQHDDAPDGASKIFDGSLISFSGEIRARVGSMVNVKDLVSGYGVIYTNDVSTIPSTTGNGTVAFAVHGTGSLSGTGLQFNLSSGAGIGLQGGVNPAVRAQGPNADHDLSLQGKGSGLVRFGTLTANADAPVVGYVMIKDAAGTTRKLAVIS